MSRLHVEVYVFWHLIYWLMHLRMNIIECKLSDPVCRSGFLRTDVVQYNILLRIDGEPSPLRKVQHRFPNSHAHVTYISSILGTRWTAETLQQDTPEHIFLFWFKGPTDILLFTGVHTTFFYFFLISLGYFIFCTNWTDCLWQLWVIYEWLLNCYSCVCRIIVAQYRGSCWIWYLLILVQGSLLAATITLL